MGTGNLRFELALDSDARFVSPVRRLIEDSTERVFADADTVSRVALVIHELLENATKYAVDSQVQLRIRVEPCGNGISAAISLSNRATPENVKRLREMVAMISAATDPFTMYQTLMGRNTRGSIESGLGLARIRAEAEMALGLNIENGDTVTITATAQLAHGGATDE